MAEISTTVDQFKSAEALTNPVLPTAESIATLCSKREDNFTVSIGYAERPCPGTQSCL